MRFIVDDQLPEALADWLMLRGHDATHVFWHGLSSGPDSAVYRVAAEQGRIIISKDSDFVGKCMRAANGPTLLRVRTGNARTASLLAAFDRGLDDCLRALASGERVVEIGDKAPETR